MRHELAAVPRGVRVPEARDGLAGAHQEGDEQDHDPAQHQGDILYSIASLMEVTRGALYLLSTTSAGSP